MKFLIQPAVLKTFRRRLTNLGSRNRSLLVTNLPVGQLLDLHETDYLLNKPSFAVIAGLIGQKTPVPLCDVLDARHERSNEVSRKLRRIDRTARFIQDERGTDDVYVGWPFVRGKFMDGTVVHGPLLFFPVRIERQGPVWTLTRRGDELVFLNPALALAYGQFNQIKLPEDVLDKRFDDFDKDPLVFRTQLYEWLKTSPFRINFNQDLFVDKLQFVDRQSAKGLDQLERTGELKLYPEAVLGLFPQAGSFLTPDYDQLIEQRDTLPEPDNRDGRVSHPHDTQITGRLLPEKLLHTPLPMDASQEAALRAVRAGQSLVVQGPPGTGKSQLIANLMADAAASGKRVLLVCQKRAALDVVEKRLSEVGMAPFLALIHDFQDDRRALYAQIAGQIEQIDGNRQQNNSLNAVLLERDFDLESRRIDEAVADLQTFKDALFSTNACGVSAKELYLTSDPDGSVIALDDVYPHFPVNSVDHFIQPLNQYAAYQQRLAHPHPWSRRVSFAQFNAADLAKADQCVAQWTQAGTAANGQTKTLLNRRLQPAELDDWAAHDGELTVLLSRLDGPDAGALWALAQSLRRLPQPADLIANDTRLAKLADAWTGAETAPGPETSLPRTDLRAFRALLTHALTVRRSWVRWNWWQLTNAGNASLRAVAAANSLSTTEPDLQTLAQRVDKRIQLEAIRHEAGPLLTDLSLPATPDSLRLIRRARPLAERLNALTPLGQLPGSCWQTHHRFADTVTTLLSLAKRVRTQQVTCRTYLTDQQLNALWADVAFAQQLRQTLRADFDVLVEADRLQADFSEPERTVLDRLSQIEPALWAATFQNALRLTWLAYIEQNNPELRMVSSLRMGQLEQILQESVQRKQALSRDILLLKLREQTYRNLTLNRLNNVVTYRDLLHQTTKKRNVWPVRKLMDSFADEVFKLLPCWLASPESVSALFPLRENLFDLVIFDEASQCFAENGIPAMWRGKQVVVTGDNQQLRPGDMYRIRLDEHEPDDEMTTMLEVESLLELAAQQLPQRALTEHYRSRSLALIAFSNQHFYQNRLQLLTFFDDANRHEPAIRYLNVQGIWQQNTNPVEADAVVQLLDQITVELPGRSVGVVTFNYPQQQLIQDKLENTLWKDIFVKNIENVQGDERDVIIFSVGYAPDERGRLAMQFGSLNARGGENRLNVAITRARERVYVITSVWPDQLSVDDALNEGPKLLKAYLQYALNVAQGNFRPVPQRLNGLPPGSLLKDRLAAQRSGWQAELPFADLTVRTADTYQSLILTDDDAYYQQTPKQAHAYLPLALQTRQWPFRRIWSREYWRKSTT